MKGLEFLQLMARGPLASRMHPLLAGFLKEYLAHEKVIRFGKMVDVKNPQPHSEWSREGDAWQEAERLGIDTSLLMANMRRTPLERIRAHNRALSMAMALRQAMRERHA